MSAFKEAIQSGLEEYLQELQRALEGLTLRNCAGNPCFTPITLLAGLAYSACRGPVGQPFAEDSRGVEGRRMGGPLSHGPASTGVARRWRSPGHAGDPPHRSDGLLRRRACGHTPVPCPGHRCRLARSISTRAGERSRGAGSWHILVEVSQHVGQGPYSGMMRKGGT